MSRFRIPHELRETISIERFDVGDGMTDTEITQLKGMLTPQGQQVLPGQALVGDFDYQFLCETPVDAVAVNDYLARANGHQLRISGIRRLGNVQILELKDMAPR